MRKEDLLHFTDTEGSFVIVHKAVAAEFGYVESKDELSSSELARMRDMEAKYREEEKTRLTSSSGPRTGGDTVPDVGSPEPSIIGSEYATALSG